jgi:hypothetical protein
MSTGLPTRISDLGTDEKYVAMDAIAKIDDKITTVVMLRTACMVSTVG